NLDNPNDNDAFVVAVNHYSGSGARPHVNIYCNGQRVLSAGYNPVSGQTMFPLLSFGGDDTNGDLWTGAAGATPPSGGAITSRDTVTVPSPVANTTLDGPQGTNLCVDSTRNSAPTKYTNHLWVEPTSKQTGNTGTIPSTTANWCKH